MCHDCCDGCAPEKAGTATFKAKGNTPKPKLAAPKMDSPCDRSCDATYTQCMAACGGEGCPTEEACMTAFETCELSCGPTIKAASEQEYQSMFTAFVKKYNKKSVRTGGRQHTA
jgi:hypothetical protein